MKTKYTKKQITEAIAHWQKIFEQINEEEHSEKFYTPEHVTISNDKDSIYCDEYTGCYNLKTVTIPSNIKRIERGAFASSGLTSVIIPTSVKNVEAFAFAWCKNLKEVVIQSNLSKIDESVFKGCTNLQSIILPNTISTIGNEAFSGSGLTSLSIPNNVNFIDDCAFEDCKNLKTIIINRPANLDQFINKFAFKDCDSLRLIFKNSSIDDVKNLENYPFGIKETQIFTDSIIESERKMKMKYTKKQITEAIAHWQKVLKNLNEHEMANSSKNDQSKREDGCLADLIDTAKEAGVDFNKEVYFTMGGDIFVENVKIVLDYLLDKKWIEITPEGAYGCSEITRDLAREVNLELGDKILTVPMEYTAIKYKDNGAISLGGAMITNFEKNNIFQ